MSAFLDRYATFANFGDGTVAVNLPREPHILTITCPDSIKRRLPTKHYVYKIVVQWSNGSTTVVYRRYSMFFDFLIKLQELHSTLCERNPSFAENAPLLPDLPGKILFGRTQIHQVAEKRRGKIEEFCQQLVSLPPEFSESTLVLGFFNTWPADTMQSSEHHSISSPTSVTNRPPSPSLVSSPVHAPSPPRSHSPPSPTSTSLPQSPPTPLSPSAAVPTSPFSATEAIISHPDEMENLEQYRVVADYVRKDSHQVDLAAGQIVHVIEKHETGWWMVMAEDEQGYAPAAYLESVEESSEVQHPQISTNEVYEAMEAYQPENEDEVGFKAGDRIEVLSKSMDGWWKIRCKDRIGFSPAALIRRKATSDPTSSSSPFSDVPIYESEKSIYEGLNIHRPPPRRNTISIQKMVPPPTYDVPRPTKPQAIDNDIYVDPASESDEEDPRYFRMPCPSVLRSKETPPMVNGTSNSPPRDKGHEKSSSTSPPPRVAPESPPVPEESPYEMDPPDARMPIYQNTDEALAEEGVYENHAATISVSPLPPPNQNKSPILPPRKTPTHSAAKSVVPTPSKPANCKPVLGSAPVFPHHLPQPHMSAQSLQSVGDYVDLDDHDEYVNPDELTSVPPSSALDLPLPVVPKPPPLPTSAPPKTRPKVAQARSMSFDSILSSPPPTPPITTETKGLHAIDDEYIEMDPLYAEVPPESPDETTASSKSPLSPSQELLGKRRSPSRPPPPTPQPYSIHKFTKGKSASEVVPVPRNTRTLTRTKSLEDILSASPKESPSQQRHSPPLNHRNTRQLPEPPPRNPQPIMPPHLKDRTHPGVGVDFVDGPIASPKPRPAKIIAGKKPKVSSNGDIQSFRLPDPPHAEQNRYDDVSRWTLSPPHAPLVHSMSQPAGEAAFPKTYVAISSYNSQAPGCLSFRDGDRCILVNKTQDGWWLVNIGGREGWTPGDFWEEEKRAHTVVMVRPPSVAPQRLPERKPRSHTVHDVFQSPPFSSMELASTSEESGSVSLTSSTERELKSPLSHSWNLEGLRPTPPPPSAKPGKGKAPPPPKPKPLPTAGSPLNVRRNRPAVPLKPALPSRNPPSASPHRQLRKMTSPPGTVSSPGHSSQRSPSPPPLPTARRKGSSPHENGDTKSGIIWPPESEYSSLSEAMTKEAIESAPWFLGKMERVQAEQFLMEHGRQREFLVRERSAKDGYYALSIRYHYSCKHFNIDPAPDGQYAMGTITFPTINDIILHYQQNSLFIHDGQHVTLGKPVRRRTRPSDASRPNV